MAATPSLARNPGTSRAIFAPRRRWPSLALSVASSANSMPSSSQTMITAPSNPSASPVSRSREPGVSSPSTNVPGSSLREMRRLPSSIANDRHAVAATMNTSLVACLRILT